MVSYKYKKYEKGKHFKSLNPYCSGRWSRTNIMCALKFLGPVVLILIVVDDGLVHKAIPTYVDSKTGS